MSANRGGPDQTPHLAVSDLNWICTVCIIPQKGVWSKRGKLVYSEEAYFHKHRPKALEQYKMCSYTG